MYIWLKVKAQNIFEIHKRTLALCLKNKRKKGRSKHEIDSATVETFYSFT